MNAKVDTALISETAFGTSWNDSDSLVRQDEVYELMTSVYSEMDADSTFLKDSIRIFGNVYMKKD